MYAQAHMTHHGCEGQRKTWGCHFSCYHGSPGDSGVLRLPGFVVGSFTHWAISHVPSCPPPNILFSFPLNGPRLICRASVARVPCIGNQCGQCPTPDLERNSEVSPITYFYETKKIRGHLIKLVSRIIPRKSCLLGPCYLSVQSHPPFSPPADHDAFRIIWDSRKCSPGEDIYSKPLAHWACCCLGDSTAHSVLVSNKLVPDNLVAKGILA